MQSLKVRFAAIAGAAAVAGLAAAVFVSQAPIGQAQTPGQPQPKPGQGAGRQVSPEQHQQQRQAYQEKLAKNLGVTTQKLQDAVKQTHKDMLADALKAGKITQEQYDRALARIDQGGGPGGQGLRRGPGGPQRPGGHMPRPELFRGVLAEALGLTPESLRTALQGGKTPVQIAQEKGMSTDQLKARVLSILDQRLAQAQQQGTLTADQVAQIKIRNQQMVDRMIQGGKPQNQQGPTPGRRGGQQ